jgi:hypothetical protein
MTAPFLSLAQIHNRLILTARWVLRDHRPGADKRCPICRITDCPVAAAARDVLRTAREVRLWNARRTEPDPERPQQAE